MKTEKSFDSNEIVLKAKNGMVYLILSIFLLLLSIAGFIYGAMLLDKGVYLMGGILFGVCIFYLCISWIPFMGLKILKPQEALVLTLFGKYIGTLKGEGFYFVNPFVSALNPSVGRVCDRKVRYDLKVTSSGTITE